MRTASCLLLCCFGLALTAPAQTISINADGYLAQSRMMAHAGQPLLARLLAERAVIENDHNLEALLQLADAHAALGETDDRVAVLEEAVALVPQSSSAHFALGVAYQFAGRLADAVEQARLLRSIDPRAAEHLLEFAALVIVDPWPAR